jgi:tRNA-specific 2-thiouridylase
MAASKKKKVYVGMSGGVDSSVSALLLQKQGYEVIGAYIKCWSGLDTPDGRKFETQCTWKSDWHDALGVAAKLKIPLVKFDFTAEYRQAVVEYFFAEAAAGRTGNPDVMCNRVIKFGVFLKAAVAQGADFIATGHYVNKVGHDLYQAADKTKDQSYFLWTLTSEQVNRSLFPLGELQKKDVRIIAKEAGLGVANKKDSQGLCFVGDVAMTEFIGARMKKDPGLVVTASGREIGRHQGLAFYTIGQRHGMGLPAHLPYYVAAKDPVKNILVVAEGQNDESLFKSEVFVENFSWINSEPKMNKKYLAKIRYRQPDQEVIITAKDQDFWKFEFTKPQRAVTPGQSLVLYDGEKMLGGGVINYGL